ncbi:MAG: hypothetical protein JKY96_07570 [Phycisphaerales bacterium]|nr:hypothetical protein [Phycisphaerales bacterium]
MRCSRCRTQRSGPALRAQFLFGGWGPLLQNSGGFGYGGVGFALFCGAIIAEFCFPVYIRLAPGQLDIFRYDFLGSGKPAVKTYDLRTIGLCVDLGGYTVALEPPRPPGEPIPEFVPGKKITHLKTHPEGHVPDYFNLALTKNRTQLCQQIVQAARTDQPTPPLPKDQLVG